MKQRRSRTLLGTLSVLILGAAAFASVALSAGRATPVMVAFLNAGPTTYGVAMDAAFKNTVASMGAKGQLYNAIFDPQKQLQQCQDVITKGDVQAIVVYPVDNVTMIPCAKQAIKAGIKITSTDTVIGPKYGSKEIQVKGVTGQVVLAPSSDGRAAANLVRRACRGDSDCKVALFIGVPQLAYSAQHKKAVEAELAKEKTIHIVARVVAGLDQPDKAYGAAQDLLSAHPDLDVISADDDSSLQGAIRYLQQKHSKVKAIGDGGSVAGVKSIKAGTEFGTVVSLPRSDVTVATQMAIKAVRGQPIKNRSVDYATLSPIGTLELTKTNVNRFTPQWGK